MGERGKFVGRVPVAAESVGIVNEPGLNGACTACGTKAGPREQIYVDLVWLVVCTDPAECVERYRQGTSAESYAAALRGEILAVAP